MSAIRCKFKCSLEYDTITFGDIHIPLKEVKKIILKKKKLKSEDVELRILNEQTKEEYTDNDQLISKNTSLIIVRVPANKVKKKEPTATRERVWEAFRMTAQTADATAQDKQMKKSIPQSCMIKVDDTPGADKTGCAVSAIHAVAYAQGKKDCPPFLPNKTLEEQVPAIPVPKDILCLLCSNIMTDAVIIPCCANSYCKECIRKALLETEEHICPACGESEISPDSLIPNHFMRKSISSFYNETGTVVKTTDVIAPPVIHGQDNGPSPQQSRVAPQAQTGPPITQIPPPRPTGAPVGANELPQLQMPPPSSQGPAPLEQLTTNTATQDEVAPLVPQTTVTDEELAKGMTIKTTVGYRKPMRLDSQDLPKSSRPHPHSRSLPPKPPMRPPGPPPPPRFPPSNMPPPWAMLSMPPRIIPPQVFPGPPPAVMLGPLPPVLLPPPPGPIPVFPPPPGPFLPPGVYAEEPLTREEFYRSKKMLKEAKEKKRDLIDEFAKELLGYKRNQTKRKSLSRSRSRSRSRSPHQRRVSRSRPFSPRCSHSRPPARQRSRSRSLSRSRSRTSPKRSNRSRSFSPHQSLKRFSHSRSGSPVRNSLKRFRRSHSKGLLKKRFSRSPEGKFSKGPNRPHSSRSPSLERPSRNVGIKKLSRSPSVRKLSRSPLPRRSSRSPLRKRSTTQKRSPLPPRKRSLSPRPRRRSRSPSYHDNFRNDWPPYCSPRSPPQQGYRQSHCTRTQLSSGYMQPGDYRSVIERAEKVSSKKQPTLASAVSTTSIKPQPAKNGHHVFSDSEGKPEEIQERKLSRKSREQSKGPSQRSHTLRSVASQVQQEGRKPKKIHRALPRKESVIDKSKFEPDYDERTSNSEEGIPDKETASSDASQSQSPSSDTNPAKKQKLDEESQDKNKKHKHRHSGHKKYKKD